MMDRGEREARTRVPWPTYGPFPFANLIGRVASHAYAYRIVHAGSHGPGLQTTHRETLWGGLDLDFGEQADAFVTKWTRKRIRGE